MKRPKPCETFQAGSFYCFVRLEVQRRVSADFDVIMKLIGGAARATPFKGLVVAAESNPLDDHNRRAWPQLQKPGIHVADRFGSEILFSRGNTLSAPLFIQRV